jgi:hypothetical protein
MTRNREFPVIRDGIELHLMRKRESAFYTAYLVVCLAAFLLFSRQKAEIALDTRMDYSFFFMHMFMLFAGMLMTIYHSLMEMAFTPSSAFRGWFHRGTGPLAVFGQKTLVYILTAAILLILSLPFAVIQAAGAGIGETPFLLAILSAMVLYIAARFMGLFFTLLHRTKEFSFAFCFSVFAIICVFITFLSIFILPQTSPVGAILQLGSPELKNLSETRFFQSMKMSASFDFFPGVYWTGLFVNFGLCLAFGTLSLGLLINYYGKSKGDKTSIDS